MALTATLFSGQKAITSTITHLPYVEQDVEHRPKHPHWWRRFAASSLGADWLVLFFTLVDTQLWNNLKCSPAESY
jgi:hypothetical protein